MRNTIKQILLLFFIITMTLILADYNFNDNGLSHNQIFEHSKCSDIPDNTDNTHSVCFEDDGFINDIKNQPNTFYSNIDLVSVLNDSFKNSYISCIWQPPKIS